jgi:hypothetical protein
MEKIRKAAPDDRRGIWKIFHQIIQSGDTYVYPPETTFKEFKDYWFAKDLKCFVITDGRELLGSYILKANQPGLGAHIANSSTLYTQGTRAGVLEKVM